MVLAALSALFISGSRGPRLAGFGPIHLLVPFALGTIVLSFRYLLQGNLSGHRRTMQGVYIGGCVVAGSFTLLPQRLLGVIGPRQALGNLPSLGLGRRFGGAWPGDVCAGQRQPPA